MVSTSAISARISSLLGSSSSAVAKAWRASSTSPKFKRARPSVSCAGHHLGSKRTAASAAKMASKSRSSSRNACARSSCSRAEGSSSSAASQQAKAPARRPASAKALPSICFLRAASAADSSASTSPPFRRAARSQLSSSNASSPGSQNASQCGLFTLRDREPVQATLRVSRAAVAAGSSAPVLSSASIGRKWPRTMRGEGSTA
mmetsp:Transcript_22366/g.70744  ORF Transcript_22366/g.70744 Transcript_22366/m.70744 type:complete len:204 (-) Transcript_22366:7-618(-)